MGYWLGLQILELLSGRRSRYIHASLRAELTMGWAALGAESNVSQAKPARADSKGIPFFGRYFMTNDLWGQALLYLWLSR